MAELNEISLTPEKRTEIENKKSAIQSDPNKHVSDKIAELDNWISKMPDRKPTKKGNLTMKQYLTNLKNTIQNDPNKFISDEIAKLEGFLNAN